MAQRNLIVLGGSGDQLPAYVEGRRLGYRIIGADQRPDALCAPMADQFVAISTREPELIAHHLGPIRVAGVLSPASDAAQPAVAALRRHFGTAAQLSDQAVRASTDKGYFRTVVEQLSLPRYRHVVGDVPAELVAATTRAMSLPVVVKPLDSSGSKGTSLVTRPDDLLDAVVEAISFSYAGQAIVEEAMAGRHCTMECFLVQGEIRFTMVSERTLTDPPHRITTGHVVPAELPDGTMSRLTEMTSRVCAHLRYDSGPIFLDFVLTASGDVYLVEMGARLGGNGFPLLAQQAFGVNTVEAAIRLCVGEPVDLAPTQRARALLQILHSPVEGTLIGGDPASALAMPEVVEACLFVDFGGEVRAYTQAANKIGYVVVVAATQTQLERARDRAVAALELEIKPSNNSRRLTE